MSRADASLGMFDGLALVGEGHTRAISAIVSAVLRTSFLVPMPVESVVNGRTTSTPGALHGPAFIGVIGEHGSGRTRILRELFERLCEAYDSGRWFVDSLPTESLSAHARAEQVSNAPFLWWAPACGLSNTEVLDELFSDLLVDQRKRLMDRDLSIGGTKLAANVVGTIMNAATLGVATTAHDAWAFARQATQRMIDPVGSGHSLAERVEHVVASLIQIAEQVPVVIVVDDAESADDAINMLVAGLLVSEVPFSIVVAGDAGSLASQASSRAGRLTAGAQLALSGSQVIVLQPIDLDDATALALAAGLDRESALRAAGLCDGLPALLLALCSRAGELTDPLEPPSTGHNPVWGLIDKWVRPVARQQVSDIGGLLASASARHVMTDDLEALAGAESIAACEMLACAGLLVVTGRRTIALRHALVRDFFKRVGESDRPDWAPSDAGEVTSVEEAAGNVVRRYAHTVAGEIGPISARWLDHQYFAAPDEHARWAGVQEVALCERFYGGETVLVANAIWLAARALARQCEWQVAIELFDKAMDAYGGANSAPEWLLDEAGSTSQQAGRYDAAVRVRYELVKRRSSRLGPEHPDTLRARSDLAVSLRGAARFSEAIALNHAVLEARTRVLGPDDPHTLTSRANLGYAYESSGQIADAIRVLEQVLIDTERILGDDHDDSLNSRERLAMSYLAASRVTEAVDLLEPTAAARERVSGRYDVKTLHCLSNLACCYWAAQRNEDAINLEKIVLIGRESSLGVDHPDTTLTRANLATSLRSAGRLAEAAGLLESVVSDNERILGPLHPTTVSTLVHLAACYWPLGLVAEAFECIEEAIRRGSDAAGFDPNEVAFWSALQQKWREVVSL
jgi:tetratricopeptide (TPR) repeat protein